MATSVNVGGNSRHGLCKFLSGEIRHVHESMHPSAQHQRVSSRGICRPTAKSKILEQMSVGSRAHSTTTACPQHSCRWPPCQCDAWHCREQYHGPRQNEHRRTREWKSKHHTHKPGGMARRTRGVHQGKPCKYARSRVRAVTRAMPHVYGNVCALSLPHLSKVARALR